MALGQYPAQALLHQAPVVVLFFGRCQPSAEAPLHTRCPQLWLLGCYMCGVVVSTAMSAGTDLNQKMFSAIGCCIFIHKCTQWQG